jgi:predicted outer membrane repeat protein
MMNTSAMISEKYAPYTKEYLSIRHLLLFLPPVFMLCLLWSQAALAVVYVDKDRPGGNGTSWAQAFNTLDAALAAYPNSAQEFWIAEGIYTPSSAFILGQNQNHSFYGGFVGTETSLSQRDIALHPVIVDGQGTLTHIFYATSWVENVRFDGLTIQGAAAMGTKTSDSGQGAGILINQLSSVVIANCTFRNNSANGLGGAVAVYNTASVLITSSTFNYNTTLLSGGGAVALYWDKSVAKPAAVIEKSSFTGNQAFVDGGAVYAGWYPLTLRDSLFIGNSSATRAGALKLDYNHGGVDKIERCRFFMNKVTSSGGGGGCSHTRKASSLKTQFLPSIPPRIRAGRSISIPATMMPPTIILLLPRH